MKVSIRRGVFETNSSSVHSVTMCKTSDYEKWKNGELLWSRWENKLVDPTDSKYAAEIAEDEELMEHVNNGDRDSYGWSYSRSDKRLLTFEEFNDWDFIEYETFSDEFDGVTAFGYYGHD